MSRVLKEFKKVYEGALGNSITCSRRKSKALLGIDKKPLFDWQFHNRKLKKKNNKKTWGKKTTHVQRNSLLQGKKMFLKL